jgi:hemoglobin
MDTISSSVTEESVTALVDRFYERVRADGRLGPIFSAAISDWDQHLQIMRDFWSAALLRTGRYRGCMMSPHFRLPIASEDFDRWLMLFRPSARETLPSEQAEQAIVFAEAVTQMLRQGMAPHTS